MVLNFTPYKKRRKEKGREGNRGVGKKKEFMEEEKREAGKMRSDLKWERRGNDRIELRRER